MAKDSHEALLNQLKNPFETRLVKFRTGGGSKQLAYIDARDVMKRLDDVVGVAGWQTKYIPVEGGFICELSVNVSADPEHPVWITKSNGANNTKVEAIKGGISSALKRAAVEWGIGRYLYYLPSHCNQSNVGQWPSWALPNNNIENWEDVAELEAEIGSGMDEDDPISIESADNITTIKSFKDIDELDTFVKSLEDEQRLLLTDIITNKQEELLSGDNNSTKAKS